MTLKRRAVLERHAEFLTHNVIAPIQTIGGKVELVKVADRYLNIGGNHLCPLIALVTGNSVCNNLGRFVSFTPTFYFHPFSFFQVFIMLEEVSNLFQQD